MSQLYGVFPRPLSDDALQPNQKPKCVSVGFVTEFSQIDDIENYTYRCQLRWIRFPQSLGIFTSLQQIRRHYPAHVVACLGE